MEKTNKLNELKICIDNQYTKFYKKIEEDIQKKIVNKKIYPQSGINGSQVLGSQNFLTGGL